MEKQHFEMLLEDIKEKVELILEGHASLNAKIDKVHENLDEKIGLNGLKIDALSSRVGKLEYKLDGLEVKVDRVAVELAAHRADTESHPKKYKVSDGK
jgi:outer membrane murein-binding lipoprotein Lpp